MRRPTPPPAPLDALLDVALDLARGLTAENRYERLVAAVARVLPCDAVALLALRGAHLVPLAATGLAPELLGRRLNPAEHPRLAAILAADGPVQFDCHDPRPDPYDGMVLATEGLSVHACMGCALRIEDEVVGALTIDALDPHAFVEVETQVFETLAALAAATVRTAELLDRLERGLDRETRLSRQLVADALASRGGELVGRSAAMQALRGEIDLVAPTPHTVLLTGETGVGKELVARTVHARSQRRDRPLVHVNCAALPESVAESEMFGHVRGAFTGAVRDRSGKFELADEGTLFLDEVGELPLTLQGKLLRALQEGELQRVGSDRAITVDVRVIAATNRDLEAEVAAGRFRADLYHRLSVYPIEVPALRARADDALLLAGHFADRERQRMGLGAVRLASDARQAILGADWPGNVRELEHVVVRGVLRASRGVHDGEVVVTAAHLDLHGLPPDAGAPAEPTSDARPDASALPTLREAVEDHQRDLVRRALDRADGSWAEAARLLDVDRSNLQRLAKRLGLR